MHPAIARTIFRIQERMLGRPSFRILDELLETERWSRERIDALRLERLRAMVATAYEHTPYWREVMDAEGISPKTIGALEDVKRFPLLTKPTLRERREEMVWRDQGPRLQLVRTSGSTNEALQFYTSSTREAHINAARMRGHEWVGIRRGEREMYYWGSPIELSKQDKIKRFRDWLINDGLTNGFEVTPDRVKDYFEHWLRWRPKCIFGYPSTFALTVTMAQTLGLELHELRDRGLTCLITTSEMLDDATRQLVAEGFGVPVYDSYGLREAGLVGHECDRHTMHTMDEQVLLETIDPQTLQPTDGEGELVVTNLMGPAMPIIRYRTGDIVTLGDEPCPCGRSLRRIAISGGRAVDFVVTCDGTWVVGYAFIYIARGVPGVVKFQVRQDTMGEVRVLVAVDSRFPEDGPARLEKAVRARLKSDDRIVVEVVDDIQPAPSGKYRPVVSKVAQELREQSSAGAR